MIGLLWLSVGLSALMKAPSQRASTESRVSASGLIGIFILLVGFCVLPFQYHERNRSRDHRAELFTLNIFDSLEQGAIIITDHWDFQSASYYLQIVRGVRPDVVVIDKSLLRYPWYLDQLQKRYPWLIEASAAEVQAFRAEQGKWIRGERFDATVLQRSYIALLSSFIEKNRPYHPGYLFLLSQCLYEDAPPSDEGSTIARQLRRVPAGLPYRLEESADSAPPFDLHFDLRGYTTDRVAGDEFDRFNAKCYAKAYRRAQRAQPDMDREKWRAMEATARELEGWR
jgi:hypothetical protein